MNVLDPDVKYKINYCIPLWLRDEHIRLSVRRPVGRLSVTELRRDGPVAVVGFGPSLKKTWEQVRDFKYIISCSGSHKFLIARGIIPTWHVEVDPRPHKVELLGTPHKDVEYLIASCCSPALFDHLAGYNVKIWHVFDATDDGIRLLPSDEWAITGGCDVGLRSLTNAAFLGFRDLHVFGIDGCEESGVRHAAEHPNEKATACIVKHGEKEFITTAGLLLAAKQVFHELDMMPVVKVTFYGDGLVQEMAKSYVPKTDSDPMTMNIVGASRPPLISDHYRELNRKLHVDNVEYGAFAGRRAEFVEQMAEQLGARTVLDYGCGKGGLGRAMSFPIWEYDPAIPGKDELPKAADLVCCLDVLEHVEPEHLGAVLADIRRCMRGAGYFIINTTKSSKSFLTGENTHLIQHDGTWWENVIGHFFEIAKTIPLHEGREMHYIVAPRTEKQKQKLNEEKGEEVAA